MITPFSSNFKKVILILCVFAIKYSTYAQTALEYNGINNYVEVPYSNIDNPSTFTVEYWVFLNGGSGNFRAPLSSRNFASSQTKGYNFYALPDDTWNFTAGNNTNVWSALQGPAIVLNEWTHLAATYDGTTLRFYVNGILVNSLVSNFVPNSTQPLRIGAGATESTPNYYFPGIIDEVRIWNIARTASQINNDINVSLTLPQTGLVSYYKFDGGLGTDALGTNNGTLMNSPTPVYTTAPTLITGANSVCAGDSASLVSTGGNLSSQGIDVWYEGACGGDAFYQGWETQPYTTVATTINPFWNGILNVTSTSTDPQIEMYNIGSFDPTLYKYINIRYKVVSGTAGAAQIFFINKDTGGTASSTHYLNVSLISDNAWHIASFDMSTHALWATGGNISGWRYDFATASGVTMNIDFIELSSSPIVGMGSSIIVTPNTNTTYYVNRKGFNINTTCVSQAVTVNPRPTPTFTVEPATTVAINTDVTYTTELGQSNYAWTIPGVLNTDYSITSGGTTADNTIVLKWLSTGSKSITVNYNNSNSCAANLPTSSISSLVKIKTTNKNGHLSITTNEQVNKNGAVGSSSGVSVNGELIK